MFHNKTNFSAALSDQIQTSARWRDSNASRYKHDQRNAAAAQRLRKLETQISVSDEDWSKLAPLLTDQSCLAAISETNRDVGFRTYPTDFTAWLENLRSNLTRG
ncbi:hypothetical protein [Bradyrhizobium sp. CCBAU 11361]|uniref:hypothetical protein n=1 Tax=Bradyrhizobium sp. CCBAU 11361 TaxID=1630812 RepID=UPI0023045440|nr:hypothetical protein [Bradyrhizobium sp. CCBAU 11361]